MTYSLNPNKLNDVVLILSFPDKFYLGVLIGVYPTMSVVQVDEPDKENFFYSLRCALNSQIVKNLGPL